MENIIGETIQPAVEFIKTMRKSGKVAIVHGHDNDSICSAAIIYKLLKNVHKIDSRLIISGLNSAVTEDVLEKLKKLKPDYVIIVDISDVNVTIMTDLRNISQIMIIDHHVPKGYVKITYVNPRVYDKQIYIPATYLCYRIYEEFLDPKEILWLAGMGTLSDMGLKYCIDLFENIKANCGELVGDNENIDETLFDNSVLGNLAKIFDSARVVNRLEGSVVALNVLIKSPDYQEVLNGKSSDNKNLLAWFGLAEKEFNRLVKDFEKKKKQVKKLVLYEVKSKYNMKSPLATYLSRKLTNEVLVIYQKSGKYVDVSFRRGKVCIVDLNQLANNLVKGIPDSNGGGHCLTKDTLLQLENGDIVNIDKIESEKILSADFSKFRLKSERCYKLVSHNDNIIYEIKGGPFSIKGSGLHKLFRFSNGQFEEVQVKDLKIGDLIAGVRKINILGGKQKLPSIKKEISYAIRVGHRYKPVNVPTYMDNQFSQILGYLIGDGSIYNHDVIEFKEGRLTVLESYRNLIENTFSIKTKMEKVPKKNAYRIRIYSSPLAKLFEKIIGVTKEKRVPSIVKKSTTEDIRFFLKGIYDAEGSIGNHGISVSQKNRELLMEVQLLLLRFGIISTIFRNSLDIYEFDSIRKFKELINFVAPDKRNKLEKLSTNLSAKKRNEHFGFVPYSYEDVRGFLEKDIPDNKFYGKHRWIFEHQKRSPLTFFALEKLSNESGILFKRLQSDVMLCRVNKIIPINNMDNLYDLEVPASRNFVANGLIVHNSQAAGGRFPAKYVDKFLRNLRSL